MRAAALILALSIGCDKKSAPPAPPAPPVGSGSEPGAAAVAPPMDAATADAATVDVAKLRDLPIYMIAAGV